MRLFFHFKAGYMAGLLLLPGIAQAVDAQPTPKQLRAQMKLTDAQILRMGHERFCEAWGARNTDWMNGSEASRDACALAYEPIRRAENRRLLARLPQKDRQNLLAAIRMASVWEQKRIETEYNFAGGGTMFAHWSARKDAVIEDLMARCLREYRARSGRDRSPNLFQRSLAKVRTVRPRPSGDYPDAKSYAYYRRYQKEQLSALMLLRQKALRLPPRPRALIAEYVWRRVEDAPH